MVIDIGHKEGAALVFISLDGVLVQGAYLLVVGQGHGIRRMGIQEEMGIVHGEAGLVNWFNRELQQSRLVVWFIPCTSRNRIGNPKPGRWFLP